jgi:hypothetical protein
MLFSPNSYEISTGVRLLKERRRFRPQIGMSDLSKSNSSEIIAAGSSDQQTEDEPECSGSKPDWTSECLNMYGLLCLICFLCGFLKPDLLHNL